MVKVNENQISGITVLDEDGYGTVNASNSRIINLLNPINQQDAVTKSYLESEILDNKLKYIVGPLILGGDFLNIQDAIDKAILDGADSNNPATIFILDGYYTENLNLIQGINLVGLGCIPKINGTVDYTLNPSQTFNVLISNLEIFGNVKITGSSSSSPGYLHGNNLLLNNGIDCSLLTSYVNLQINDSKILRNGAIPVDLGLNAAALFNHVEITRMTVLPSDIIVINKNSRLTNCITIGGRIHVQSGILRAYGCTVVTFSIECLRIDSPSGDNEIFYCGFERRGATGYAIVKDGLSNLEHGACSYRGTVVSPSAINVIAGNVGEDVALSGKIGPYKFPDEKPSTYYQMPSANPLPAVGTVLTHTGSGNLQFQVIPDGYAPGGINRSIQFNNNGLFDGSNQFIFHSSLNERAVRFYSNSESSEFVGVEFYNILANKQGWFGFNEITASIDLISNINLNLNSNEITSNVTNDLSTIVGGSLVTSVNGVGLIESYDQLILRGANELHFLSNGVDWKWPTVDGYSGQAIVTDGYGVLSFANLSSTGIIIQDEGSSLPQQSTLNFIGTAINATNDIPNNRTNVIVSAQGPNRSIQFNSDGNFDGSGDALFYDTSSTERVVVLSSNSNSNNQTGIRLNRSTAANINDWSGRLMLDELSGTVKLETNGLPLVLNGGNEGLIWPSSDGYNGQAIVTNGSGVLSWSSISGSSGAKVALQFVATEEISNTNQWLYSWRGNGSTDNPGARSGASGGLNYAGACSPIVVPADGYIDTVGVRLVRGAVNAGTANYPVKLTAVIQDVGFNSITDILTLEWFITSSNPVGIYTTSGYNTDYRGLLDTNLFVTQGQLLAVKFIGTNPANGSNINIAQNLFINLYLTEL